MADARAELRAAWDDFIAELQRARDAIDDPKLYPPPPSDRNLAGSSNSLAAAGRMALRIVHAAREKN